MNDAVRRWERGRARVDDLRKRTELQRVPADQGAATRMLQAARTHIDSAAQIRERDPEMAMAVAYDAARRALAALLETQGLRPTSQRGHIAHWNTNTRARSGRGGLSGLGQPWQPG